MALPRDRDVAPPPDIELIPRDFALGRPPEPRQANWARRVFFGVMLVAAAAALAYGAGRTGAAAQSHTVASSVASPGGDGRG